MKTTVAVIGAEFHAYHGYYEEERLSGHTFIIDLEVELAVYDTDEDEIKHTVNYESLYNICSSEMKITQKLLETVAYNTLCRVKSELKGIMHAKLSIEKLAPQLGGKVKKTRITMEY